MTGGEWGVAPDRKELLAALAAADRERLLAQVQTRRLPAAVWTWTAPADDRYAAAVELIHVEDVNRLLGWCGRLTLQDQRRAGEARQRYARQAPVEMSAGLRKALSGF